MVTDADDARTTWLASLISRLSKPIDSSSLCLYRILFGLFILISVLRYIAYGWVEDFYVVPDYHFPYAGFEWVTNPGSPGIYLLFGLVALSAALLVVGLAHPLVTLICTLGFTYIELIDKTTYLNHYYLVSILGLMLTVLPLKQRLPWHAPQPLAAGWLYALRLQVGLVYFFAGLAKLNYDWLILAQPLKLWLPALDELPIIGPLLRYEITAYVASWMGALFDLSIGFLLCMKRMRPWAFAAVVVFHVLTGIFFKIGIFPWVMIANASLFFAPDWPRRVLRRWLPVSQASVSTLAPRFPAFMLLVFVLHFALQIWLPLRPWFRHGNFLWHEDGYRFGWKVMLMEKAGVARFLVRYQSGNEDWIYPSEWLSPAQVKMMSTQADMIVSFAHHLARELDSKEHPIQRISAEVFVSFNGRRSQRFIDPQVNLLGLDQWSAYQAVLPWQESVSVVSGRAQ